MTALHATAALVIDADRTIVTLNGRAIDVQRRQYQMLKILAGDPTRCFTSEEIARGIWGDSFKRGNSLRSQASLLRRALGGDPFIVNVHQLGYRLVRPDDADLVEIVTS